MSISASLLHALFIFHLLNLAASHGLMTDPPQRGTLSPANKFNTNGTFPAAPADQKAHFPAGDKDSAPGAAARSQMREANNYWTPFEPLKNGFRWRAGVCGDLKRGAQAHMRSGVYYYDGKVTRRYTQAQDIEIEINIVAHHNGFVQIHVCDVARCGGEISEACFRDGHCKPLLRAPNASCDSGEDLRCAPIDPEYPERWYLPCTSKPENVQERFGGPKMKYRLPKDLTCEHCVLHWFWSAANICNPPGVIEFFEGPHGPKTWGYCFGQGGAKGGYTKVQKSCAPDRNPEEYYQCADIAIESSDTQERHIEEQPKKTEAIAVHSTEAVSESSMIEPRPVSSTEVDTTPVVPLLSDLVDTSPSPDSDETFAKSIKPTTTPTPGHPFREFSLVADGEVIGPLPDGVVVDISRYEQVAIEVVIFEKVSKMDFYIDRSRVWTEYKSPYFLFGNKGPIPFYWKDPIKNRYFELVAQADGSSLKSRIMFTA